MSRPTKIVIDGKALIHNLEQIKRYAPQQQIIAMVKANAYGCQIQEIVPLLEGRVQAFGVACLSEALLIRKLGSVTPCLLMQGVFTQEEYQQVSQSQFGCMLHEMQQLRWLLETPLAKPLKVWVKVNTGMNRLGFKIQDLPKIMEQLQSCAWVDKKIGLMSHLACADEPWRIENKEQIELFQKIPDLGFSQRSLANSAGIIALPQSHADVVRPGIMLYGVSPFAAQNSRDLGLKPVMHFYTQITAIHDLAIEDQVGYGGTWSPSKPSRIAVVAAGYGDGYPRHIAANTPVWIKGREVPIVGRVSMDMLTVDLTAHPDIQLGAQVELWGSQLLVERIAQAAGTTGYELLCQITKRPYLSL